MGLPVIIYGKSGSGKSRALLSFDEDEIFLINVVGKELPFRKRFKYAAKISSVDKIIDQLKKMPTNVAVIDDAGYIMTSMFMNGHRAPKKGATSFDLFNDIGDGVWNLMRSIVNDLPRDKVVYFNFHEMMTDLGEYVVMRDDYSAAEHAKVQNQKLLDLITLGRFDAMVIECMEARTLNVKLKRGKDGKPLPMPMQKVGMETYETCYWIGRFMEAAIRRGMDVYRVLRSEEKSRIIPTKKNKLPPLPAPVPHSPDAQIRKGLIMRFAQFDKKNGKGRANCRDVFYGFKADEWSAFAVGVVHLDREKEKRLQAASNA